MRLRPVSGFAVVAMAVAGIAVSSASPVRAGVRVYGPRVERQQITELRYTPPAGRVITGLGFRAHYDNLTTMYCRHHAVSYDGALVDPQSVRIGSEPDHECEARIDLPEGWVAVGFGAAGEPEWDVTLLRVWARQLQPDGTLGDEVREFSDGFNPERGPERYVVVEDSDRVLTAAGLRFGVNDITGIFAESSRIRVFTAEEEARLAQPIPAWRIAAADAWEAVATEAGRAVLVELSVADPGVVRDLFAADGEAGRIAGIVVPADVPRGAMRELVGLCAAGGRELIVRQGEGSGGAIPSRVRVLVPAGAVAADAAGQWVVDLSSLIAAPRVPVDRVAAAVVDAAAGGAAGVAIRVAPGSADPAESTAAVFIDAVDRIAARPARPTDLVWSEAATAAYGSEGAENARLALQQATAASDLVFGVLGLDVLRDGDRVVTVDEARERLERIADGDDRRRAEQARLLLNPSDKTVGAAALEKKTARWLLDQAVQQAVAATEAAPSPAVERIHAELAALSTAFAFWEPTTSGLLRTWLYRADVAAETRFYAEQALDRVEETADAAPYEGIDAFLASARASLETAETTSPFARALAEVRRLSAEGEDAAAAEAFADLFANDEFAPHLRKQNEELAEIATSLRALSESDGSVRCLRGADGEWIVTRKGGDWCFAAGGDLLPCVYLDAPGDPLDPPATRVLSFDYFDEGTGRIWVHYDSDYEGEAQQRQYHPADPVQLRDSGEWKRAEIKLEKCLFSGSQNCNADMRFLAGELAPFWIRNPKLEPVR